LPDAPPAVVWFRGDLRLRDQPALAAAATAGGPVALLYVLDDDAPGRWAMGGASRWWLHHSLAALARNLAAGGTPLCLRRGRSAEVVAAFARDAGAATVHAIRQTEPFWRPVEDALARRLAELGIGLHLHAGATLFPTSSIVGRDGGRLRVFTPFWRACRAAPPPPPPLPAPDRLRPLPSPPPGEALDDWRLLPTTPDWAQGLRESWQPGEAGALARLAAFVDADLRHYRRDRDRPEPAITSHLSPHLHFGEVSPRQVWHAVGTRMEAAPGEDAAGEAFLREVGWREFNIDVLDRHPELPDQPLQRKFAAFPWAAGRQALRAWQRGRTGYPLVDAGMRQLWHTGWMHNRIRMVAASFLVKHLLIPWQDGEAWFWDTLVDADLANNAGGWQWVAGCGTDAAPFFRIFNPVLQGEKFDPRGAYIRRWVPELAGLPDRWIHKPWQATALELAAAGVRLGADYPKPIVDHGVARARALAAFAGLT